MGKFQRWMLATVALGALAPSVSAQLFVVEDFNDRDAFISGTMQTFQHGTSEELLLGTRLFEMTPRPGTADPTTSFAVIANGRLTYQRNELSTVIIGYGSGIGSYLGVDFTRFRFLQVDAPSLDGPVDIYVETMQWNSFPGDLGPAGNPTFLGTISQEGLTEIPYFLPPGAQADDVARLMIEFRPQGFGEYQFDSIGFIAPVPEPQTYALISSLGLAAFAVHRRRKLRSVPVSSRT